MYHVTYRSHLRCELSLLLPFRYSLRLSQLTFFFLLLLKILYKRHVTHTNVIRPARTGIRVVFQRSATMAPFEPPEVVLTGFKERIEALTLQGIFILEPVVHSADPW
jgi:hypothetical protein